MAASIVKRNLTFATWASTNEKKPFDLDAAANALAKLAAKDIVLPHGQDLLTAGDHVRMGTATRATELQLLALHDAANAPSEWGPGAGARPVTIGKGRYTAFFTHVLVWPDKMAQVGLGTWRRRRCAGCEITVAWLRCVANIDSATARAIPGVPT